MTIDEAMKRIEELKARDAELRDDGYDIQVLNFVIEYLTSQKKAREDAIEGCINEIVSTKSIVAENTPFEPHLFTVMADRQKEIIRLLEQLKEKKNE